MGAKEFAHNPTALHEGGQQTKSLVDGNRYSGQLQSCKVPEDAWGLLGQVWFHGEYEKLLEQLSSHVTKMNGGIQGAGQKMTDAATSLREVDEKASKAITKIAQDHAATAPKVDKGDAPKSGNGNNPAFTGGDSMLKAAPGGKGYGAGSKFLKDISSDASGADIGNDVTGLLSGGTSLMSDGAAFAADPIGWLINKGVSFIIDIIKPLKDCLEMVTGNGAAVNAAATNFNDLGRDIDNLSKDFEKAVNHGFGESRGDAAEAARESLSKLRDGVAGTAGRSGDIASLLQFTSMIMQAAEDFIKGIITDVIEYLLLSQVTGWLFATITAGLSEVVATATDVAKVAQETVKAERKIQRVEVVLKDTANIWQKISAKFVNGKLGKTFDKMNEVKGGVAHIESKSTGLKNTLKDSVKDRGAQTVGYNKNPKNDFDRANSAAGITKKASDLGKMGAYNQTGEDRSDEAIDQDLDT